MIKKATLLLTIFVLLIQLTYSQQKMKNYEASWKKIDSLIERSGLVRSALAEVNKIYADAGKTGNDAQVIKALIYRMSINDELSEQSATENIALVEKEADMRKTAPRAILKSLAATSYWNYLRRNRWRFYNRTTTVAFNKTDVETWSLEDLHAKISSLFLASLEEPGLLKQTKLETYDELIEKGNSRALRPTLFDLLAHRALDYFRTDERAINKPAYTFEIEDSAAYAPAKEFVEHRFISDDTASLHWKALQIYQQLLAFHLNDVKPDALVDADLARIEFVHAYSVVADKDDLYKKALELLVERYGGMAAGAQAIYMLAEWHAQKARTYDPLRDSSARFEFLEAEKFCNKALQVKEESPGKINCLNLLNTIRQKNIRMEAEKVNSIGKPFRVLVNYQNFTTGYFRILKMTKTLKEKLRTNDFWKKITALPAQQELTVDFPDTKDYQEHRAEIRVGGLPSGEYALLAGTDEDFGMKKSALALQNFYVSDISYVNTEDQYYLVNRNTGAGLAGAKVQLWEQRYDKPLRRLALFTSNEDGYFKLNSRERYRLDISYGKDRLFMDDDIYHYYYSDEDTDDVEATYLFTDRSIYRPGQTVYFKGIVVSKKARKPLSNRKTMVKLYNANGEVVDSMQRETNAFGSFSGKYTLPTGVLNGEFSIRDEKNHSAVGIRVEEYKRPKFYVEIPKPSGTYRVEDSVDVEIEAKSYAGNNINGAEVKYRVVRSSPRIMWGYDYDSRIWPPYPVKQLEITHGSGMTDENGKLKIRFKAIPDKTVDKQYNPVFNYEVTADVTDLNGETRSGAVSVSVGYQSLQLVIALPSAMPADSLRSLPLSSVNMNDVFEKTKVAVTMFRLKAPAREFRKRFWQQPDQFVMSREEYYREFPFDLYADEDNVSKWGREAKVFEKSIVTETKPLPLDGVKLSPGWYAVEALAKDKDGEDVRLVNYVHLTAASKSLGYADKKQLFSSRFYVRNNRVYIEAQKVELPVNKKILNIEYVSFRDKTLPGTNETWKIKISGWNKEKVAAELLTSMYDASLDQFLPHNWTVPGIWADKIDWSSWSGDQNFTAISSYETVFNDGYKEVPEKTYDRLMGGESEVLVRGYGNVARKLQGKVAGIASDQAVAREVALAPAPAGNADTLARNEAGAALHVQPRTNLSETAFFFPDLHTDSTGNISFSFTAPEALTEWRWMLLAHTKALAFAVGEKKMVTQKELMVQPNLPRFLREGDRVEISAKIANMSPAALAGTARLQLVDPSTGETVDQLFANNASTRPFNAGAGLSSAVAFSIAVPKQYTRPLVWRITAVSGAFSDGEESVIPVISNRMLVTETMPLPVKGNGTVKFEFEKLLASGSSSTLDQHALTIEYTANPSWYAVQALPYLAEGKKENAEQIFNRYYANALASHIAKVSPSFLKVIATWKETAQNGDSSFYSKLNKNEELKSLLLQETPWVMDAKNETQQKKNIALLFDLTGMSASLGDALSKLQAMQTPEGGFPWYPGGRSDEYMTRYIIAGLGRLKQLGALPSHEKLNLLVKAGIHFLDQQLKKEYEELKKNNKKLPQGYVGESKAHYLYMRSLFPDVVIPADVDAAYNYYRDASKRSWLDGSPYVRGLIALSLFRTGDAQIAGKIMAALGETSIHHAELGMYWKEIGGGYYWYQAPVESQSLLIEAFAVIKKDNGSVDEMKTWLLKNKQTNNWSTTRSTADACYALLLQGSDWTAKTPRVDILVGGMKVAGGAASSGKEAGTGYFKNLIKEKITPAMGNIEVKVSGGNPAASSWGSIYWQYFEDLDKISTANTPLQLAKKLFIERNTDRGPVLEPVEQNTVLKRGDKIKVRIELRVDREMEYVHMKDMRASCMEPVNVLSGYKWQGGLGYYESTGDASTNFFFDRLAKGVYVFEYPLFAAQNGQFSNGITTIQCMYAPEFTSHSEGVIVNVKGK